MAKTEWYATPKLKELREERGYTQKEMADLISLALGRPISDSLYQKWEQQVQNLMPEQVLELSRYFKTDYKELVEQRDAGKVTSSSSAS